MLTIPRLIRNTLKFDRALLGELHHAAHTAIATWRRQHTGQPAGQPSLVVAVQTFGDFLFWHPHVHVLAAAGVFAPNGDFHLAPPGGWQELGELWRHTVLRRLRDAGALADWQIAKHPPENRVSYRLKNSQTATSITLSFNQRRPNIDHYCQQLTVSPFSDYDASASPHAAKASHDAITATTAQPPYAPVTAAYFKFNHSMKSIHPIKTAIFISILKLAAVVQTVNAGVVGGGVVSAFALDNKGVIASAPFTTTVTDALGRYTIKIPETYVGKPISFRILPARDNSSLVGQDSPAFVRPTLVSTAETSLGKVITSLNGSVTITMDDGSGTEKTYQIDVGTGMLLGPDGKVTTQSLKSLVAADTTGNLSKTFLTAIEKVANDVSTNGTVSKDGKTTVNTKGTSELAALMKVVTQADPTNAAKFLTTALNATTSTNSTVPNGSKESLVNALTEAAVQGSGLQGSNKTILVQSAVDAANQNGLTNYNQGTFESSRISSTSTVITTPVTLYISNISPSS